MRAEGEGPRGTPVAMTVGVACSGGRDSLALLHATVAVAQPLGLAVVALHVNHALQPEAERWARRLRDRCARWARSGRPVSFQCRRLASRPAPGDSLEAWARQARYEALADMARASACDLVLLAQHRRDQAETLLLQALRGAGVAGLAGMPADAWRDGIRWCRPWLDRPREDIEAYVRRHRLVADEDPSNADPRYARNRLRLTVWPALLAAFPSAEKSLASAARHAAEAAEALAERAVHDAPGVADAQGLAIAPWLSLPPARRKNLLRAWLHAPLGGPGPASLVDRLLRELPAAPNGSAWPAGSGVLRLHRGRLNWHAAAARPEPARPAPPAVMAVSIRRAGRVVLAPWGGTLTVRRVAEGGVPLAWLAHAELRARVGGEQFQAGLGRPPRSLKKQFQAAKLPAWARTAPLLFSGGQLVFVPGLGLDARVIGLPGTPQVQLEWADAPTPSAPMARRRAARR